MARPTVVLALLSLLLPATHALFECVGTPTGACENDSVCCQDDAKCYPLDALAIDPKLCLYSCTCTAGDKTCEALPCFNRPKSMGLPCFGKTCGGHGECANGKCYCDRGWGGEDCKAIECLNNCNGLEHGQCVAGVCKCKDNWMAEDCSQPVCPEGCSGHGKCTCTEEQCTCACAFQWRGPACGQPGCPSSLKDTPCSGHGECLREGDNPFDDTKKFGCRCDQGWMGADCGERTCFRDCMNRGECHDGVCTCQATHSGEGCQHRNLCGPDCERFAQHYGRCNSDQNKCQCEQGWEGFDCLFQSPTPTDCLSGGARRVKTSSNAAAAAPDTTAPDTTAPDTAASLLEVKMRAKSHKLLTSNGPADTPALTLKQQDETNDPDQQVQVGCGQEVRDRVGAASEQGDCPSGCTDPDRGVCIQGECICKPGFSGPACAGLQCSNGCSGNGLCDPTTGLCTCNKGATGLDCGQLDCMPNGNPCHGKGECRAGKCICEPPFVGKWCESKVCPVGRGQLECSGDGMCGDDGACHCPPGRGGLACEKDVCLNDCSGTGLCRDDVCFCSEGRSGDDCSLFDCPIKGCSGRGKCETATGTCVCEQGYTGDGCEASVCGHECSENSVCNVVTKVCECASGVHDAVGCDASNNANGAPSKVSFKAMSGTTVKTKGTMSLTGCATGCSDKCAKGAVGQLTDCNLKCTKDCLRTGTVV